MISSINEDEYIDLVNDDDKIVGKKKRSEIYSLGLSNFRVVNLFVKSSKGKLWIPRRTKNKRIFPLCLDISVGGHVKSSETYEEALKREVKEEIRIDINNVSYRQVGYFTPYKNKVSAFMKVYELNIDEIKNYNRNDFSESYWLYPEEVIERIAKGDKCKSDLPVLINLLYIKSK